MKQASDDRQPHAAPKVRTPPRQASNATIEAVFSDDQPTRDTARGDERTNHRHTPGAISFSCPVGDGERHDARCGHSNKIRSRPLRAAGRAALTNRLTLIAATPARSWRGACPLATHHDRNGPASVPQADAPSRFRHTAGFLSGATATLHRAAFDSPGDFLSSAHCAGLRAARSPIRGGVSVMAKNSHLAAHFPAS
jgi:hypothetical protein